MEGKREDAVGGDGEKMEIAYSDHRPTLGLVVENVKPPLANDGQIEMDLAPKSVSPAELMDEATETSVKEVEGKNVSQSDRGDDKKITESADVYVGANIEANDGLGLPVDTISSLSVIANYGSDSYDSDDNHNADEPPVNKTVTAPLVPAPPVIQPNSTPPEFPTDYRKIQPSSDDSESDSSASSDNESSSSSSTESFDGLTAKSNGIAAAAAAAAAKMTNKQKVPRTEEEIVMGDLPPIADLHISVAEASCLEMGYITSIVDSQVVIHAKPNVRPLNLETVLFLDKGQRPLGVIFDVFGQVTEPFYSVRFNSAEHVKQKNISVGMVVYCAPNSEHTNYVFVDELMKVKASDAVWDENDTPVELLDFSDDEAEQNAHRTALRSSSGRHQGAACDLDQPPRKRVNSFERRMNERNLQKSALPPEPRNPFAGVAGGGGAVSAARGNKRATGGFAGQQRGTRPPHERPYPSPFANTQPLGGGCGGGYQARPPPLSWDMVAMSAPMHAPQAIRSAGPFQPRSRPFTQGRGYGFGPFPSSRLFAVNNVQSPPPQMRYGPASSQPMPMGYSMASPGGQGYPAGFMPHGSQPSPYPVLLRPATFQPPHYDAGYPQTMPFGSRPPAFPPGCYHPPRPSAGPPQPPMRGQPYNPMFSGMALFNPGFPPPQLPPRVGMYPIGPPPPPRGGV